MFYLNQFSQLISLNHLEYIQEASDAVCLYYHDPSIYNPDKVRLGIEDMMNMTYVDKSTGEKRHLSIHIKKVYCVINEKDGRLEVFAVE